LRSWGLQTHEATRSASDTVEGITIPTLLEKIDRERIDILKLDIEGSEEALFRADSLTWLRRVGVVLIETHGDAAEKAVLAAMNEASFTQIRTGHRLVFVNSELVGS
jgi:hypothetical protein